MFYAVETLNDTAVGPFATRELADAWILAVVPPCDRLGAGDYPARGYRTIPLTQLSDPHLFLDLTRETPAEAAARYRDCYAEYYPDFVPGT
jgi:hypothetical protein